MSTLDTSFRLEVNRVTPSDTRWIFQVLDEDDRSWSGEPRETYATRREATQAGEAALKRLLSKSPEQLAVQLEIIERQSEAA